jgi:hypothetical protein
MCDAQDARFEAFLQSTDQHSRDWIAFLEFENAIHEAVMCAGMIDLYDAGPEGEPEHAGLKLALSEMLFRVPPRVDLGPLIADVEGIGYALRYGIIEPKRDALDNIKNSEDYEALAKKGYAADQADTDRRMEELMAKDRE